MIQVLPVDTKNKLQVKRFVQVQFSLYANHAQWVPPLWIDAASYLDRSKHPFYEHSEAEFFIASREDRDVGRIAVLENKRYNDYHNTHQANFYFFDCEEDPDVAASLFECACRWANARSLEYLVGPKGFGPLDGYGLLVEGYEHRQAMTMMNYNYPYYVSLVESQGFEKEVDFVSCYLPAEQFRLPERVHRIARRVQERGALRVMQFDSKRTLKTWVDRIGEAYNRAFIKNWEYSPLTDREIKYVVDNILLVANPKLIKVIIHDQDVVGFLFAWPDVSAALQRTRGKLLPFGLFDLLLEMRRTKWVAINGMGILEEYQGHGGNALLYAEMEKTIREFNFQHADLTQVAESAVQMRQDLINLGGTPYKNHRVYRRKI